MIYENDLLFIQMNDSKCDYYLQNIHYVMIFKNALKGKKNVFMFIFLYFMTCVAND